MNETKVEVTPTPTEQVAAAFVATEPETKLETKPATEGLAEPSCEPTAKKSAKKRLKGYFSATRIAYLAVFTALAFVLYMPFLEFSLIPAIPFMKIDFSNTFVMIAGFSLGPVAGIIVGVLKELLHGLAFSQTVGVGELANILLMLPFVLIPSIIYKRHKGIKAVLLGLGIGSLAMIIWSVPVSYLLTFPFYMSLFGGTWVGGMELYLSVWYWSILFNLVKVVLISTATMLLYKSISRLIKLTNARFEKLSKKSK